MVRISLVPYSANRGQVHKLPKNRPIDSIDLNRLRKNKAKSVNLTKCQNCTLINVMFVYP